MSYWLVVLFILGEASWVCRVAFAPRKVVPLSLICASTSYLLHIFGKRICKPRNEEKQSHQILWMPLVLARPSLHISGSIMSLPRRLMAPRKVVPFKLFNTDL